MNKGGHIAVLGSGPMGLAVAYQLVQDGHHPVLFEADDRVGGMSASFDFGGLNIERYYHFHCISDQSFLELLTELGLKEKLHWAETKMGFYYQGRVQPWGNPIALLTFSGLHLPAKIRYGLHAFYCVKRNDWTSLDKQEATGWIRSWVGEEAYEVFWQKLFDYKFYDYAQNISAAWIWSRIRRIGRSRYNLFREKLGYLEGGSDTLLFAMKNYIESEGGEIRLSSPAEKVVIENGKVCGVVSGGVLCGFDKVISTIPLPYLKRVIPDLPTDVADAFNAVKNIAVVCVIGKLKKKVTDNFWLNINDPEMDIPGLVEYSNLRKLKEHIIYVPFYMPAEHAKFQHSDQVFKDKVIQYLSKINPALQPADFKEIRVHRYHFAQPICTPGYLDGLPEVGLPVKGLWVADSSYYYPEDRGISDSIGYGRDLARKVFV